MRASVIFGPGCSERELQAFQGAPGIFWLSGPPASKDEPDVVLLLGGDGTLHRHLQALLELQRPVLVVPRGSGNDFARALGLRSVKHAVSAWRKFVTQTRNVNVRPIDVGVIKALGPEGPPREHYFGTVAGVGLDGEVARRANRLPRWLRRNGGYALTLLPSLLQFAPLPMKILLEKTSAVQSGQGFQPTVLAAFANVPAYGGGMRIAPQARMDDGQLDICAIRKINKFKLFCLFPMVYFGRHLSMAEVEYSQAASVRLETECPLDVYADGEYVCRTPVEISVKRNALRVIVPPGR